VSHDARMEVWEHSRSEGGDKLVLLALAEHADKDTREAWPSIDRLSSWTGLGRRSVQRSLRKLERLREVVPVALGGGRQQSARYRIVPREGAMQPTLDGFGTARDDALYVADDALSADGNGVIGDLETVTQEGLNGDAHAAQTENSKKEPEPPSPLLAQGEEQGDLLVGSRRSSPSACRITSTTSGSRRSRSSATRTTGSRWTRRITCAAGSASATCRC
jgi:hypothetical protein